MQWDTNQCYITVYDVSYLYLFLVQLLGYYLSPNGHKMISESELLGLKDGDTLIMRVDLASERKICYGKETYIPMNRQSENGISKFYSILTYLVSLHHFLGNR